MADGNYILGIRPHHVTQNESQANSVVINGLVRVAEISGSESMVRVDIGNDTWVSESHGVHTFEIGELAELSMLIDRCLYFSTDGNLVAS